MFQIIRCLLSVLLLFHLILKTHSKGTFLSVGYDYKIIGKVERFWYEYDNNRSHCSF